MPKSGLLLFFFSLIPISPALAQLGSGFQCINQAVPFDNRAQGATEPAGDQVLTCTGGTPIVAGGTIPSVDITVSTNVNITSRLSPGNSTFPSPNETVLLMDEPGNGGPTSVVSICPSTGAGANPNCTMTALGSGGGIFTNDYDPTVKGNGNRYNGFQGTLVAAGQVTFFGVPVDPPGYAFSGPGNGSLIMRITNLRVNASGLGIPAGFSVNSVFATISTTAGFPILNNVQTISNVRNGIISLSAGNVASFPQCTAQSLQPAFTLNLQEGFYTAFRQRLPVDLTRLSIPGYDVGGDAESLYLPTGLPIAITSPGIPDFGTRIKLQFQNVPAGITLYVPLTVGNNSQDPVPLINATLTATESGPYSRVPASPGSNGQMAAVTNGVAIYEVGNLTSASPNAIDTLSVPVAISYSASSVANYPPNGTATVTAEFAPVGSTNATTGPIPQFIDYPLVANTFNITACSNFLATPASAALSQTGSVPVALSSSLGATSFTVIPDGQSFYSVKSSGSSTPATLTFTPNASGILLGSSYTGSVKVQPAVGPVLTIPVSLSVPSSQFSGPSTVSFTAAGSQIVPISSTAGALQFTGSVSGSFLNVTTNSFTTPASLTIVVSSASLKPGFYQGSVTLNATNAIGTTPLVINVNFTLSSTPASQTITFGPLGNVPFGAAPFAVSTTASSGLPVTLTSNTPSVCTVSGSVITPAGAGGCSITASQSGNASYAPAPSVTQTFAVGFLDVHSTDYFFSAVNLLAQRGITTGCGNNNYCPASNVTRYQMAVFIVRAVEGGDTFTYSPTPYFKDVPANAPGFQWIQRMYELGITAGCGSNNYCPNDNVTRDQMAVFIMRARYGAQASFTYSVTPAFTDVPASEPYFQWIQRMSQDGITAGCGSGTYCPNSPVTRGDMAIFIMRGGFNQLLKAGTPVILEISPATLSPGYSGIFTITGSNTNFVQGVTELGAIPGFTVWAITVNSSTSLTVELVADVSTATQPYSIVAITGNEQAVLPNGLSVQ